ncbi:MAG: glutamine-hydrolyzing carbamoyl-phosphate synthase small subunit [Chitinivibrionales bacterium]|nr:glutamine-hydrolyzing carbamoyl-phosphate synthase small subunit [Chitinivibrionales bacterium]MBD3358908.1 glutamine-hydrolyzing carbamoyl-phosphate synthase small subunit [Chitinivibrionales bacterium]
MYGIVALEDGTVFEGESFGAAGESVGEVVFNTSMTGYQEVLTDPSYSSQIITMTYPLIGNYGVNEKDVESTRIQVAGFVVKEACPYPSNFASHTSLGEYLRKAGIVGVSGIDTRALTRHIRLAGAMKAVIYAGPHCKPDDLVDKAKAWKGLVGIDMVKNVTCQESYRWDESRDPVEGFEKKYSVVAYDFGIKHNILRILRRLGCDLTVVPASTSAQEVLSLNPDGVFLSNGPGDPAGVPYAVEAIKGLMGKKPMFGICLGHQLLSLALGGSTYKLKFGHRGANHPVKNLLNDEIAITSQNHGFCASMDSLQGCGVRVTHLNLNDNTVEGIGDFEQGLFSVQYHPEASPGPHDSAYLFENFVRMIAENAQ